MNIPHYVKNVIDAINQNGGKCWLVGGCVRDFYLGREPRDYDLLTDLPLSGLHKLFGKVVVKGRADQESAIVVSHGLPVDVASLGDRSLDDELARRDFTVNSLAYDLAGEETIDLFGGIDAINSRLISGGEEPAQKIAADPIRIVRAVRFACEFGFCIEENTYAALCQHVHLLQRAAAERIRDEFVRMLMGSHMVESIVMMQETGIMAAVCPEIDAMNGCPQSPPHRGDVFEHTTAALAHAPEDLEVRLAVLLHDIGKPPTMSIEKGAYRFYGHHTVGAKMARALLERLRFPAEMARHVEILIDNHMFTYHPETPDSALYRLHRDIGGSLARKLVDVRICDWQSIFPEGDASIFEQWRQRMSQISIAYASGSMTPVIDGNDIMRITGLTAGPEIGMIMSKVIAAIEDSPENNNKKKLEELVRDFAEIYVSPI